MLAPAIATTRHIGNLGPSSSPCLREVDGLSLAGSLILTGKFVEKRQPRLIQMFDAWKQRKLHNSTAPDLCSFPLLPAGVPTLTAAEDCDPKTKGSPGVLPGGA
jgi:hypothetical protein